MSLRINKAYFFVPLIYVAIIFGLLLLQFTGGERTTRSVGQLVLQATRAAISDEGQESLRSLELAFGGLVFELSDQQAIRIVQDGTRSDLGVMAYEEQPNGFLISMAGGYQISALTNDEPVRELQIRVVAPEGAGAIDELQLPFSLENGARIVDQGSDAFLSIENDGREFYLTVPPEASIDREARTIILEPEVGGAAIRYVEATTGDPAQITRLFEDSALQISGSEMDLLIDAYIDAAYLGWSSGRYNAATLTWDRLGTSAQFSELALTGYLAEAWVREDYDRAFSEMRRARDLHPEQLSLLSSPFLGNLEDMRAEALADGRERAQAYGADIVAGDAAVFQDLDAFAFAAARGSEQLYAQMLELAQSIHVPTMGLSSAVGLLANISLSPRPDQRVEELAQSIAGSLYTRIIAGIVQTPDGFFLQTSPGQIDVYQSLLAGKALEQLGVNELAAVADNPSAITIGRNLIAGVLSLADAYGTLPTMLVMRGEGIEASGSRLPPERVYPFIRAHRAYPRMTSFYDQLGSGHWSWTVVPLSSVQLEENEWRFVIQYPRLQTHYLLFFGVPPFERMTLFGQTWRDAPDFEVYSKGRHYNAETDTLMIKYYDDSVRREIVLYYSE